MGLTGAGALGIWWDADPAGDADMNHWHSAEHIAERVSIPGFLRARRYTAVAGHPTYFVIYGRTS